MGTEWFDSLQLLHNLNKILGRPSENQAYMHESLLLQSGSGLLQTLASPAQGTSASNTSPGNTSNNSLQGQQTCHDWACTFSKPFRLHKMGNKTERLAAFPSEKRNQFWACGYLGEDCATVVLCMEGILLQNLCQQHGKGPCSTSPPWRSCLILRDDPHSVLLSKWIPSSTQEMGGCSILE